MADLIIRVVNEGLTYDLDIDNNIPLRLDVSAVENQRIGSFFGVGSQKFVLPGTKNNNKFFKHGYTIGATDIPGFYNTVPGYIIHNGETLLDGQFQLLEIITDNNGFVSYSCRITDSVVKFNDAIADKLIKNGNWTYLDHTLSYNNIIDSWDNNLKNGDVYYPLAEYGFDNPDNIQLPYFAFLPAGTTAGNYLDNPFTPIQANQLLPAVRIKSVLDVIFDSVNFKYTGSFVTGSDFDNLYLLPKAKDTLGLVSQPGNVATCTVILLPINPTPEGTNSEIIPFDSVTSDPTGAWSSNPDHYYSANTAGDYTFSTTATFFNPTAYSAASFAEVTIQLKKGNYATQSGTVLGTASKIMRPPDGFNIFSVQVGATTNISSATQVWAEISYSANANVPLYLQYGTQFRCTAAPEALIGGTVDMGLQFGGQTKSIDLLNGLVEQFNLVLTPVQGTNNVISIDSFDDWVRAGEIKDWSYRYDMSERISINHTVDEQPKQLLLKNVDDVDRFSKAAIDSDPNYQYGTLRIIADNNISQGQKTIGDYFGPTVLGGPFNSDSTGTGTNGDGSLSIDLNNNFIFPHLYRYQNSQIQSYTFKPRIGYKVTNGFNDTIYIGATGGGATAITGSYTTIANVATLPVIAGQTKDLLFNNTYTQFTAAASLDDSVTNYDQYWKTYLESLYWSEASKITMDLEFEPHEYYNIKLNDRIFINDNFYRINKIKGYNVSERDISTVELIKLYPQYFEGIDVCEIGVTGSLDPTNCP